MIEAEKYSILIQWSEEDNCYVTSVPDLPGCMSDGKTPEEAIKNTQVIISEWIEAAQEAGKEIPKPSFFKGNCITSETIKDL